MKRLVPGRARLVAAGALVLLASACGKPAATDGPKGEAAVVNVYSGRHYDADAAVFAAFTRKTGIDVRSIEAEGGQLLERLKAEGEYSNADLVMTVDAGNLDRLVDAGLLQPTTSPVLAAVPARYRDPDGRWYAFSKRARVIVYRKGAIDPASIASMDALATPALKGKVCARQSSNLYNLSLLATRIAREGRDKAKAWAQGVASNFARAPQGSDTDQIRAVAAGECTVAIVNHYYLARMRASEDPADQKVAQQVDLLMPDQAGAGAHVNISGAGVAVHAPHPENARKLLEFLTSAEAQKIISDLNDEFPIAAGVELPPQLAAIGAFKEESEPFTDFGALQGEAQKVFDEAGWR